MLTGAIIAFISLITGYCLCYFTVKKPSKTTEVIQLTKKVKPSFKNPMRTFDVAYEKFKTKDNNLYGPVKPKGGDTA